MVARCSANIPGQFAGLSNCDFSYMLTIILISYLTFRVLPNCGSIIMQKNIFIKSFHNLVFFEVFVWQVSNSTFSLSSPNELSTTFVTLFPPILALSFSVKTADF